MNSEISVPLYNAALNAVVYFPNYPSTLDFWMTRGWVTPPAGIIPPESVSTALTIALGDARYARIGSGGGGGGSATTDASLLTSGILPPARIGDGSIADAKLESGTALTAAERTKLSGVATGATANSTDAQLRDRSTHTGTQAATTITGLATVATSGSYNDLADKPTVTAATSLTRGLGILYAGLAARTIPCRIVGAGSSTMAGSNATAAGRRFFDTLIALIQAAYPSGTGQETAVAASTSATFTPSTATGVHGFNAGEGGTTAATYLTSSERTSIAGLNPRAVLHMVGANDYANGVAPATYKANVQASISDLKSKTTVPCVHVLIHTYQRMDVSSPAYPWSAYGQALAEIAAADPDNVAFIDISEPYRLTGVPGSDPLNLVDTDNVHQTDPGHALMADLVRDRLGIALVAGLNPVPAAAAGSDTTAPTISTFTATPGDSQVALAWSGSDNVGITRWLLKRGTNTIYDGTATSYTDTGRTNGTQLSYSLVAYDAAGNTSNTATATATPAAGGYTFAGDSAMLSRWDAATLSALANGANVSSWSPAGGSETAALAQATTAQQPVYTSSVSAIANKPAVTFTNDFLDTGAWTSTKSTPITAFAVVQIPAAAQTVWTGRNGVYTYAEATTSGMAFGAGAVGQLAVTTASGWKVVCMVYDGANSRAYVSALTAVTGTTSTTAQTANAALPGVKLGTTSSGTSGVFNGAFAEVGFIGAAVTDANVKTGMQALATKYGLTLAS